MNTRPYPYSRLIFAASGIAQRAAPFALRYGLVIVFLWFGGMKFTSYEAGGIAPFVMNSPVVGWWHALFGIGETSVMLGVLEIAAGLLLAVRPFFPLVSAIGGAMGVVTFLITLTFFLTTPGVSEPLAGDFPAISAGVGQFLLKDVVLLAASLWCLGDSLQASATMLTASPMVAPRLDPSRP